MKMIYIFLGHLNGIGGGQIYLSNKIQYLETNGWDVYAFAELSNNIKIQNLKRFKDNGVKEIAYPSYLFNKRKRNRILNFLIKQIN